MSKRFFIIMGRSGSGKGTQAALLKEKLAQAGFTDIQHVTTGGGFRTFIESDNFTAKHLKKITNAGGIGPEFMAIWVWVNILIDKIRENTTMILDGAPRRLTEAEALHGVFPFYGYDYPTVIYLDTSDAWATDKLVSRHRADDENKEDRERKMSWFFTEVLPCVAFYKNNPLYTFVHINGEKSIEEVHAEIIKKVGL